MRSTGAMTQFIACVQTDADSPPQLPFQMTTSSMGDGTYVQAIVVARTSDWPHVARALQSSPILEPLAASTKVPTIGTRSVASQRLPALQQQLWVGAREGDQEERSRQQVAISPTLAPPETSSMFTRGAIGGAAYIGHVNVSRG
jgi:hypothetical protein